MRFLDALTFDRRRLGELIEALARDVARLERISAALLTPLARRLRRHLMLEDQVLFAALERSVPNPCRSATTALRREQGVLRQLLREVEAALDVSDGAGAAGNLLELAATLRLHGDKVVRTLYPVAERVLQDCDASPLIAEERCG